MNKLTRLLSTESSTRGQRWASTGLAAGLACLVLLPMLGHKPLTEWDEGIYAEVSREMLGGSWLVPHWNYQLWFEKPPLLMWITAVFFKLFGVSDFWARAASAFAGVGCVALVHGWLGRRRDLLAAWLSSVILLATFGFLHVCHVGETDTLLALWTTVALVGLSEVEHEGASGWLLFWLGFALAVMTKGAAAVCVPLAAGMIAVANQWPIRRFRWSMASGMLLFGAIVLPWHILMWRRFHADFVREYLGLHVVARAAVQIEGHHTHWWYYLTVLLVSAPPFVLLYPAAVMKGLRGPELRPFACFAVLEVLFFSVVRTRLPHYVAPVYPVVSLLAAVWSAQWLRVRIAHRSRASCGRTAMAAGVIWAAMLVATHPALKRLHSAELSGAQLLDNREADALLRQTRVQTESIQGALLVWRNGPVQSIATMVFYSQRQVQQVSPMPDATRPQDRYMNESEALERGVGDLPMLLLLDGASIRNLPAKFTFTPIASSASLCLGTVVLTQTH